MGVNQRVQYTLQTDNNPETVKKLISMGSNVKKIDKTGLRLLSFALMDKTYKEWRDNLMKETDGIVETLKKMTSGTSLSRRDIKTLSVSSKKNKIYRYPSLDTVKILIKNGAKFNTWDVLDNALDPKKIKDKKIFKYLIKSGANINMVVDDYYGSLLTYYSGGQIGLENEYAESVKLLLELGANTNIQTEDGSTALHRAIFSPKIFRYLLEYNPNIEIRNNEGKTILDLCNDSDRGLFYNKKKESCQMLRNYIKR